MMKTNNNYWAEREASEQRWIAANLKTDADFNCQMQVYYDKASRQITDRIDSEFAKYADYSHKSLSGARLAVASEDVKAYEARAKEIVEEAHKLYKEKGRPLTFADFSKDVNDRLKLYNVTMRVNRLEMLKSQIGQELTSANLNVNANLLSKLGSDYQAEIARQAGILGQAEHLTTNQDIIKILMERNGDYTFSNRIWINQDILKSKLDDLLVQATIQGQNPRLIARQLKDQVKEAITNQRYVTERIARTESARIQTKAQLASFNRYGYEYCKWVAEPSACKICTAIDSENDGVYPVKDVPAIPVHPNCRCSIAAYAPSDEEPDSFGMEKQESAGIDVHVNDALKKFLGKEDSDEIVRRLQQAPDRMQKMWAKYQDSFAIERYSPSAGSFYSPRTKKVTVSPDAVHAANKSNYLGKYDVVYHEFGHAIDHFALGNNNFYEKISERKGLGDAMNDDFVEYRDKLIPEIIKNVTTDSADNLWGGLYIKGDKVTFTKKGKLSLPSARKLAERQIGNEISGQKNWPVYGDVSDMVEAATNGRINPGVGHGKKYWSYAGMQDTEAFAEMTSATINNPESLAQIQKIFPNAYKKYLSIVDDIIKTE